MRRSVPAIALLMLCIAVPSSAQEAGQKLLTDWLVLWPIPTGGRVAVHPHLPFKRYLLPESLPTPKAGDQVEIVPKKGNRWERTSAPKGVLKGRKYGSAWCLTTVTVEKPTRMILVARGFRFVIVNGAMFHGDTYRANNSRQAVALRAGPNVLLFHASRGELSAKLVPVESDLQLNLRDLTLPDLRIGERLDAWGGAPILNTTDAVVTGATLEIGDDVTIRKASVELPPLSPLGTLKEPFPLRSVDGTDLADKTKVEVPIRLRVAGGGVMAETKISLRVRKPGAVYKDTFISAVDGSVQYYAIRPPVPFRKDSSYALILSCHGAGVQANGQARAYSSKSWAVVAAATNRRPFGFDWEDWGRIDALEVMAAASKRYRIDPEKVYVTGHSMGGHGTWHLGVTFPDRFAAIGPSAGWISFWTYGGALKNDSPAGKLFRRAIGGSDTLALLPNLAPLGIQVIHGSKDKNVPPTQAKTMLGHLAKFHRDFRYHEQPGAGHWWNAPGPGTACVDLPDMWRMFRRRIRDLAPTKIDFSTASPGISHRHHWASLHNQKKHNAVSRLRGEVDPRGTLTFTTTNLTRFRFDARTVTDAGVAKLKVVIDGAELAWEKVEPLEASRVEGAWRIGQPADPGKRKRPGRYGPFKQAFTNRFVMVYGTGGSPAEQKETLAKARFDAGTWWYRGNGRALLVPDTAFDAERYAGRNLILYGNETTNTVWASLAEGWPLRVKRGEITLGERKYTGADVACTAICPHPTDPRALIGLIGCSGPRGMRLTLDTRTFLSGTGRPDVTIWDTRILTKGLDGGILLTGFWGDGWGLDGAELAER